MSQSSASTFIEKWSGITASELSTSQSFLIDLCDLLGVPHPHPTESQEYLFERPITFKHGDGSSSSGRIDLYKRGCFILESKKINTASSGKKIDERLLRARSQAENYARALPAEEGRPPSLIVVDVGNRIELYSEFSRSGGTYTPFPDPRSHRIPLKDLAKDEVRERLRKIWLEPMSLDPSRESARVTREIAGKLAELAKSLEASGQSAEAVARFLTRSLFTMFAEDVGLLPEHGFTKLLIQYREQPDTAMRMTEALWEEMDRGGFSAVLAGDVLQFNGKLFKQPDTLPLSTDQLDQLIEAGKANWKHVEPAIFGTLLERALDPRERHKLGAHYTPRAYVERLVMPTIIEPLRAEWAEAQAAALTLAEEGKAKPAMQELAKFHHRLCSLKVLDPACGSGNFLYVTLEHLKRLEGEVLNAMGDLGGAQGGLALETERFDASEAETVDPHNLLGIEVNPRAAAIAEVVLWIGYLQWHFRTRGNIAPPQPVIKDFSNIECRDAVLAWDDVDYVVDDDGKPVTRWDGVSMKVSPVTGKQIPDESARIPIERYINPRKADWPQADFVIGNPPFIGNKRMRIALGDGYVEALRASWPAMPESADFVMYWWQKAAQMTQAGDLERFGFITTNSIRQTFNRRVLEAFLSDKKQPLSLVFAIPDHPWVDTADGAAVRIAMTVATVGSRTALLSTVVSESELREGEVDVVLRERRGVMFADLKVGSDVAGAQSLISNRSISFQGCKLVGDGFRLRREEMEALPPLEKQSPRVRRYRTGTDIVRCREDEWVIDLFGLSEAEARSQFPACFNRLLSTVKPFRDTVKRKGHRERWWLYGEARPAMRNALANLSTYLATSEVSKHRVFVSYDWPDNLCDGSVIVLALDSLSHLGTLSSIVHSIWSLSAGGRMGVGNDPRYQHQKTFEPFPFPAPTETQAAGIRSLAEQLDAHRKQQQAEHPKLTLTGMYNVLEALRAGTQLSDKEKAIHEQGLVSVLRQLHDELDAAVLDAYGWSDLIPMLRIAHGNDPVNDEYATQDDAKRAFEEVVLERLVALNAERAAEEAKGLIRWLRPEFQNPDAQAKPEQAEIDTGEEAAETPVVPAAFKPVAWPKDPVQQVRALSEALSAAPTALTLEEIAQRFKSRGKWKERLPVLIDMLVAVGRAREESGGRYLAQ